jgi:SRSO17 transposase
MERYLTGLLTDLPHKTCDTIADVIAGTSIERLQHLLTDAAWDPLALDEARVKRLLAQHPVTDGILVFDDTGLPKKGSASVGVAPQYSGTLGKIGNCQVVVSAEYLADDPASSTPFHWPVSAQLFLPESWAQDAERRKQVQVPEEIREQTKPEIALGLLDRARQWGVPIQAVVVDAGYGDNPNASREDSMSARSRICVRWRAPSAVACPTRLKRASPTRLSTAGVGNRPSRALLRCTRSKS